MRYRLLLAVLLSAITVTTTALVPTAANAGSPNCPSGHFCAWRHLNFDGGRAAWHHYNSPGGNWATAMYGDGGSPSNNSSSWHNNGFYLPGGADDVWVYDNTFSRDFLFCVWRGNSVSYLASANDRPSSHAWKVSC
jgi:hypothetical protein